MAVSHDLALATQGVSLAHTRYAMEVARLSTRVGHLTAQVFGCVARGQLTPAAIEGALDAFAEGSAAALGAASQAAVRRFAEGLSDARPGLDAGEAESIADDLRGVATGERTVGHSRRGYRAAIRRSVAQEVERAAEHWFELLGELYRLRAVAAEGFLLDLLRTAAPIGFSGEVVHVEGALGGRASTEIELVNEGDRPMTVRASVGDLRRSDGVDAAFRPAADAPSPAVSLDPGGSGRLGVSLTLDPELFRAGRCYVGTLEVVEDLEVLLALPLVVEASGPS